MAGYWVRFAATGDPNGGGAPVWPVYGSEKRDHLVFGDEIQQAAGVRNQECALFDDFQALRLAGE